MNHQTEQLYAMPMTIDQAAEVCEWTYPTPYNIYGWLPFEQMQGLGIEFGDPDIRSQQYISIMDEQDRMWGFAQLFPMEGVTRIGLGMRPDWCGLGMGKRFVKCIVDEAIRRQPSNEIDLEVLTWNKRAIRTYQQVGFQITDTYERMTKEGNAPFHCMVYKPLEK